jgi:hypothetical protein
MIENSIQLLVPRPEASPVRASPGKEERKIASTPTKRNLKTELRLPSSIAVGPFKFCFWQFVICSHCIGTELNRMSTRKGWAKTASTVTK